MKIELFEKYKMGEDSEISSEYANIILSRYIDKRGKEKTLKEAFDYYCDGDQLDDNQKKWVLNALEELITELNGEIEIIIDTKKYNI